MQGDLTTLDRVQAWLSPDQGQLTLSAQQNTNISRLITSVSRLAMNYMGRDTLGIQSRTETYSGGMTGTLLLRFWPVLSVESLGISGQALDSSSYTLEPIRPAGGIQRLYLSNGRTFQTCPGGVAVSYTTGFVKSEEIELDSNGRATTSSVWLGDVSVALLDGTVITGYTVEDGVYDFTNISSFSADPLMIPPTFPSFSVTPAYPTSVVVTYQYVPEDIEQAVIDNVGLIFRGRGHIGESSRSMANNAGTTAYIGIKLSDSAKEMLQNYTRTVPL